MRRRYLITYDIGNDKRRDHVFKALRDRGDHVQFSVFLCELNAREYALLKGQLQEYIHQQEDQVLILDLGLADDILEIGQGLDCVGFAYNPPQRVRVV
mgnify:CR=1 FL=1